MEQRYDPPRGHQRLTPIFMTALMAALGSFRWRWGSAAPATKFQGADCHHHSGRVGDGDDTQPHHSAGGSGAVSGVGRGARTAHQVVLAGGYRQ